MGQSYNFCDKITTGLYYPGKTTVLGVAAWMAEQPEDRREVIALVDRLFTDAKKHARFAFRGPSWYLDIYRKKDVDEIVFCRWAVNAAIRVAAQYGFVLHVLETESTMVLFYEGETGGFSITFNF